MPLVIRVDSIQAKAQAAEAHNQRREEAASNRWIVRFTGALVAIALFQLGMFLWQLLQIRASLADTRKAADAADKSARAADLSARAAVHVERPHVVCSDVILTEIPRGGTQDRETGVFTPDPDTEQLGEFYRVQFVFTNYGRTPAFGTHIGWGFMVGNGPPANPGYKVLVDVQGVLQPGEVSPYPIVPLLNITPDQRKAINGDKAFPWFWGFIRYSDFFDGVAEVGFIARHDRAVILPTGTQLAPATLHFHGPPAYTFKRYRVGEGEISDGG